MATSGLVLYLNVMWYCGFKNKYPKEMCLKEIGLLFSLFSMTRLGNAQNVVLSRCHPLVNMTNGVKLSYYQGNTKT